MQLFGKGASTKPTLGGGGYTEMLMDSEDELDYPHAGVAEKRPRYEGCNSN